ncbi:MAG: Antitoxin VapB33 [Burkholderiaceae bacterium]|nr:Antitoxin VapB33 [Burkholderiaceae bacterium]
MRTTVTLDADVQRLLKDAEHRTGRPFKQVLNDAVRAGLGRGSARAPAFRQPVFSLGRSRVDLTKATALAGELEDQAAIARTGRKPRR